MSARRVVLLLLVLVVVAVALMRRLSETEASRLATLRPEVRAAFERLRAAMALQGVQLFVVSTRRTADEQAAKVAAGLSGTGSQSWHLLGRALDFNVGIRDTTTGKLRADAKAENVTDYRRVHDTAHVFGFRGIPDGRPFTIDGKPAYITNASGKKIWDVYHLEYTEGMSYAQAAKRDAGTGVA